MSEDNGKRLRDLYGRYMNGLQKQLQQQTLKMFEMQLEQNT